MVHKRSDQLKTSTQLMQENLELARENNKILKGMRRSQRFGLIFKVVFWLVILGAPVLLYYYFFAPYIEQILGIYTEIQGGAEAVQNINAITPRSFPGSEFIDNILGRE